MAKAEQPGQAAEAPAAGQAAAPSAPAAGSGSTENVPERVRDDAGVVQAAGEEPAGTAGQAGAAEDSSVVAEGRPDDGAAESAAAQTEAQTGPAGAETVPQWADAAGQTRQEAAAAEAEGQAEVGGTEAQRDEVQQAGAEQDEVAGDEEPEAGQETEAGEAQAEEVMPDGLPVRQVVEALLFATDSPLPAGKIAQILERGTSRHVRRLIRELNEQYEQQGRAFRVEEVAGGYQMLTVPAMQPWLAKLLRARQESRLSPTQMETLAVVAYKQPVLRADVEVVRGVACGDVINRLREMGLVKIVGRAEDVGRPLLYGTTKKFLRVFGLGSLDDLPRVEELRPPEAAEPVAPPEESPQVGPQEPQAPSARPAAEPEDADRHQS